MAKRRSTPTQAALDKRWSRRYSLLRGRFRDKCEKVKAPCHLCGQPIDYSIPSGDPMAWECDHFYPVEDYPELFEDPANFRPSHKDCNGSRGRDEVKPTLGTPSREW